METCPTSRKAFEEAREITATPERLPDLSLLPADGRIFYAIGRHTRNHAGDELAFSSSFGIQSAVLLHLMKTTVPDVPVIFIDTQHLHPKTYAYKARLENLLELDIRTYRCSLNRAEQEARFGRPEEMNEEQLQDYRLRNKVEPMNRALQELGASGWISGLRREQAPTRSERGFVERQGDILKYYPILDWTSRDVFAYMQEHNLPAHPLWEKGYTTVGDYFENPQQRQECGLHHVSAAPRRSSGGTTPEEYHFVI